MEYWGYHLVLDLRNCDRDVIQDETALKRFVLALVDRIGMKAYGEPILKHFATHNADAAGYSLLQLIETSNIAGHFVDCNGDAYLDIFSCKRFSIEDAIEVAKEYLNPKEIEHQFLERGRKASLIASD